MLNARKITIQYLYFKKKLPLGRLTAKFHAATAHKVTAVPKMLTHSLWGQRSTQSSVWGKGTSVSYPCKPWWLQLANLDLSLLLSTGRTEENVSASAAQDWVQDLAPDPATIPSQVFSFPRAAPAQFCSLPTFPALSHPSKPYFQQ